MAVARNNDGGMMDVIRCDERDYLIWKWRPRGVELSESRRANSIRYGSSLRVKDGSVAVFVYTGENGNPQEFIEGPFDGIIDTVNFPVLSGIVGAFYDGDSPVQAEVYFINLAGIIQLKFGVPYFDVFDARIVDMGVPVAVRGSISFKIDDYREFIRLHGLNHFDMNDFRNEVRDMIARIVKSCVANAPEDYGIPLMQLERRISEINDIVEDDIKQGLEQDFGVSVRRVDVSEIEIKRDSEGYRLFQEATNNSFTRGVQAARNAVDTVGMQRMGAKRMKSAMVSRMAQPIKPRRGQVAPVQEEQATASAQAAPDAVSQVAGAAWSAANGLFGAIGGLVGKAREAAQASSNTAPVVTPPPIGAVPPPIPVTTYYVAVGTQQTGPYTANQLAEMAKDGLLNMSTLVWCEGMAQWEAAGGVDDLKGIFE